MIVEKFGVRDILLRMLYPRRCPICGEIVIPKDKLICESCRESLVAITEPRCKKCSKPLSREEQEYCYDCIRNNHHYNKGYAVFVYDLRFRASISEFKYKSKKEYGDFYIEEIVKKFGVQLHKLELEALIPVPLHSKKRRQRGFNQAEMLAEGIGRELGIPMIANILVRKKDTIPQKKLDNKERKRNLEQAFSILNEDRDTNKSLKNKRVALVDDIYTTGSTIEACTKVLLKAGCAEVFFITVCIGRGF